MDNDKYFCSTFYKYVGGEIYQNKNSECAIFIHSIFINEWNLIVDDDIEIHYTGLYNNDHLLDVYNSIMNEAMRLYYYGRNFTILSNRHYNTRSSI